jgi:hypothetical protein
VSDFDPTHSSRKTAREQIAENNVKSMNSTPLSIRFAAKMTHPSARSALILEDSRAVLHLAACRGESPTSC